MRNRNGETMTDDTPYICTCHPRPRWVKEIDCP
jgi:hypothetical protein